jgi:hypothetical protein
MIFPHTITKARRTAISLLESASFQIDRFAPYIAAALLVSIYLISTFKSFYKPLWFDEIFTALISKLPTLSDIVSCTKEVPDGQPVLYYFIVRASIRLFGNDPWGLRVPSTIGYVVFCLSLYLFVSRQTSRIYGLLALLLPGITGCWYYATEGRPYGLVLGATGLAALSWQSVAMNRHRKLALAGLCLSLLFAFSVHYFATLLFVPFAIAELVRSIDRKKLDIPVWAALIAPFSILIFYLPIMQETLKNSGRGVLFPARPGWFGSWVRFADSFLGPTLVALIGLAFLYVVYVCFCQVRDSLPERGGGFSRQLLPYIGIVLPLVWLFPFTGIALGKWVTRQFFPRYVIGSMFGFTALATLIVWFAFQRSRNAALIVSLLVGGVFAHSVAFDLREARHLRANPPEITILKRIPEQARFDDMPVVFADVLQFLEFRYYADAAFRRRMYYVTDEESAFRILGYTAPERGISQSPRYFNTQVVEYDRWVKQHPVFYVFGGPDWLVPRLIHEGAHLQVFQTGADAFYRVTLAGSVATSQR